MLGVFGSGPSRVGSSLFAVRLAVLSCAAALVEFASAGCGSAPTAISRTPTPTATPTITPAPTQPGITPLNLPIAGPALPSPDGTMIAGADAEEQPHTVTIYTLDGTVLAQASAPQGDVLFDSWLPDSSGLLIWPFDPQASSSGPSIRWLCCRGHCRFSHRKAPSIRRVCRRSTLWPRPMARGSPPWASPPSRRPA